MVIPSLLSSDDFGEASQDYSLVNQKVSPFLGDEANGNGKSDHWRPVSRDEMAELAKRSQGRIASNEEFTKVHEELEKARSNGGVVRLSEVLKEKEDAKANGDGEEEAEEASDGEEEDEPLTPQLEEALNVLVDLLDIGSTS